MLPSKVDSELEKQDDSIFPSRLIHRVERGDVASGLGPGYIRRLNSLPEPETSAHLTAKRVVGYLFPVCPSSLRVPETLSLVAMYTNGPRQFFFLSQMMNCKGLIKPHVNAGCK